MPNSTSADSASPPVGHIPTLEEAKERLEALRRHGPTPYAFTFKQHFDPPSGVSEFFASH